MTDDKGHSRYQFMLDSIPLEIAVMRVFRATLPLIPRKGAVAMVNWMLAVLADPKIKTADEVEEHVVIDAPNVKP